jgi:Gamma-butyrobetaine hydroxylase-like, N-terminal
LLIREAFMGADLELVVGGRPIRFPAAWLRDNCPCPECLAPGTGQKLIDITDIPNGLAITHTEDDALASTLAVLKREQSR